MPKSTGYPHDIICSDSECKDLDMQSCLISARINVFSISQTDSHHEVGKASLCERSYHTSFIFRLIDLGKGFHLHSAII